MEAAAMSLYAKYWEDFPEDLTFETRGITVTETHIVVWSMVAGDWLPIHVDREFTAQTAFGEPIAHGPLTLSLALGLVTQSGIYGDSIIAWLGLDEVRLPAPVRIGDTIRVHGIVEETGRELQAGARTRPFPLRGPQPARRDGDDLQVDLPDASPARVSASPRRRPVTAAGVASAAQARAAARLPEARMSSRRRATSAAGSSQAMYASSSSWWHSASVTSEPAS